MRSITYSYRILCLSALIIIFYVLESFSQRPGIKPRIDTLSYRMIAKIEDFSVKLRWAPLSSKAWLWANKEGYMIEKTIITKGKNLVNDSKKEFLALSPLRPLPLDSWEDIVKNNKFAPIVAQALYGENFVLSSKKNDVMSFINAAKEQENRFSFALFACDMSWDVSIAAGLAFEDKKVNKNERYLYKVYPLPRTSFKQEIFVDTAFFYIGLDDFMPTPRITRLEGDFSDRTVMLKWNQAIYGKFFTAYQIERSADGKTFIASNDIPFISPETESGNGMIYRVDSLPKNETTYYFRVRGITPFGELSQPSDTVSGQGYVPLKENPMIVKAISPDNKKAVIQWTFAEQALPSIVGFEVEESERIEGIYQNISPKTLDKQNREFSHNPDRNSTYYRVKAVGKKKGEYAYSYPHLVQLVDSTPPASPQKLLGKIDSNGVVKIEWQKGRESDLYGYRIYRSNSLTDEFSQITKEAVVNNKYIDTIELKALNKNIYYAIVAVDTRFNPSIFSEVLELKRPDVIAPSQAVFSKVVSTTKGVELFWEKSASDDLEVQVLYRKEENSKNWTLLAKLDKNAKYYLDEGTEIGKIYYYTIVSVDDAGLESKPASPVQSRRFDTKERQAVEKLQTNAQRDNKRVLLTWKYPENQPIDRFLVYKAKNNEKISVLGFATATAREYTDEKNLMVGNTYYYKVKVVYKDGTESVLSPIVKVDW